MDNVTNIDLPISQIETAFDMPHQKMDNTIKFDIQLDKNTENIKKRKLEDSESSDKNTENIKKQKSSTQTINDICLQKKFNKQVCNRKLVNGFCRYHGIAK